MRPLLESIFEEQLGFSDRGGDPLSNGVFIGDTELFAVETLRDDKDAYTAEFNAWLSETYVPKQTGRLKNILSMHNNTKRFADLCTLVKSNYIVPFIGSGMSAPSGKKLWSDFLRRLRSESMLAEASLEAMLARGQYEDAADAVAKAMPPQLFDERIEHELRLEPTDPVRGAVRLLPGVFESLVVTTNLDDVLERRFDECGMPFNKVYAGAAICNHRKDGAARSLLKLHGDCRDAKTRVLGTVEYDVAYGAKGAVREELANVYRNRSLLCLGCSLADDRTVGLMRDVAAADKNNPKHYALCKVPGDESERVKREHFLTERNIFPIWYTDDHDECIEAVLVGMLREMKKL
jgi:hypothetical protein